MNMTDGEYRCSKRLSLMVHTSKSLLHACGLVLFPRGCAGCEAPDEILCAACRGDFSMIVGRTLPGTLMGRCYAAGIYRNAVRAAMLSWKDHGDREVSRALGDQLARLATRTVIPYLHEHPELRRNAPIHVLPVPSSRKSLNNRGRLQTLQLAGAVATRLNDAGIPALVDHCMRVRGDVRKSVQTGGLRDRASRASGLIHLRHRESLRDVQVIVVDDIVTTASTLRQCMRVLADAGARPLTALLLASTLDGREPACFAACDRASTGMDHRHLIPTRGAPA
ncbi:MAG: phosphoribosyltransferase family protein [Bifidobacterium crudilactis]|jgi:predicted amidophosphoribosyltransferase